jgi:hypothetical protein
MVRRLKHCYVDPKEPGLLDEVLGLVQTGPTDLVSWNIQTNDLLAQALNIKTTQIRASELPPPAGDKQQKIIGLCRELGVTHYLCGPGSRSYVTNEAFAQFGIRVEWIDYDYEHEVCTKAGLATYPSILDSVLRRGVNTVRSYFAKGPHFLDPRKGMLT